MQKREQSTINVIVLSTLLLSFISYWRASAVVIADLASSAYYTLGVTERAVGSSAPWFVLIVMLFAYGIRAVHIEAASIFVRGGTYNVVREGMGDAPAKFAVSALIFDYLITGPISAVSAGQYCAGLVNSTLTHVGAAIRIPPNLFAVIMALAVELYFWRKNVCGIKESSKKALRIFQITALLAVMLLTLSIVTIVVRGEGLRLPPFSLHLSDNALGFLRGASWVRTIGLFGVLIGMGHAVLAISGEETLAQIYREIEAPKLRNLLHTGLIIFLFAFVFTGINSLFAAIIVPQKELLTTYNDNILSGLAMHLVGTPEVHLLLQGFVVLVGFLLLAGAVNTAFIGANSVLNRLGDAHVMPEWFRVRHPKYETSSRNLNILVVIQLGIVLASRGDVFLLGEMYAFGVIWSFIFKAFSIILLRFTRKTRREDEWHVPGNVHLAGREIPVGLSAIFLILLLLGVVILLTKPYATIGGIPFTILLYILLTYSERKEKRKSGNKSGDEPEQFQLRPAEELTPGTIDSDHPRRKLVAIHRSNHFEHFEACLRETDPKTTDIIVLNLTNHLSDRANHREHPDLGNRTLKLFSEVVRTAEKEGKTVIPVVASANNILRGILTAAVRLKADTVYVGNTVAPRLLRLHNGRNDKKDFSMKDFERAWADLPKDKQEHITLIMVEEGGKRITKREL